MPCLQVCRSWARLCEPAFKEECYRKGWSLPRHPRGTPPAFPVCNCNEHCCLCWTVKVSLKTDTWFWNCLSSMHEITIDNVCGNTDTCFWNCFKFHSWNHDWQCVENTETPDVNDIHHLILLSFLFIWSLSVHLPIVFFTAESLWMGCKGPDWPPYLVE
jgi:hypothetical protein